jgi:periplasmic divalent cation tolerance protein
MTHPASPPPETPQREAALDLLAVFTTVATAEQAQALALAAVEQGLAACVQAESIRSTYRWQGEVVTEAELRLMFKTSRAGYPALERLLLERHPYDLPAVFAVTVAEASPAYAGWVRASIPGGPGGGC